jgi:hypothetical protein
VALLLGLFVLALLVAPLVFWLAWNVLDLGPSMGLPELGFWPIVLAALFLVVGWFGKTVITAIVFLVEPGWLDGAATVGWPEPSFANVVAIALLAILAGRPHARSCSKGRPARKKASADEPWREAVSDVGTAIRSAIDEEHQRHRPT